MANKITTLGYFKKRLRDCSFIVDDLYRNYAPTDPRNWTVVIDPGGASIMCTCYVNANAENIKHSSIGDFYFELHDGGQFVPNTFIMKTSSIEVIVEYLERFNIAKRASAPRTAAYMQTR